MQGIIKLECGNEIFFIREALSYERDHQPNNQWIYQQQDQRRIQAESHAAINIVGVGRKQPQIAG